MKIIIATNDGYFVSMSNPFPVAVVSGGGGVQYSEGDTSAAITGTAMMAEDTQGGADELRPVTCDNQGRLYVNIAAAAVSIQSEVIGLFNDNQAAPNVNNLGVLPAVANAADRSLTEGRQVLLRTTLAGDLAVTLAGEAVGISTSANSVKITDGTDTADVLDLANSNPLTVAIVDASGTQITSFGGGTQFADGAARGTATGTLAMGDDGTNIQSLSCDTSGRLNLNNIAGSISLPTGAATSANQLPDGHNVTIDNASGGAAVNIQDGGNSITIDGSVSITGTVGTELPTAAALSENMANPTAPAVAAHLMGFDGSTWDRVRALPFQDAVAISGASLVTTSGLLVFNGSAMDTVRGANATLNAAATGLFSAVNVAQFDDTAPTAITENQFGNLRMSSNRNLYGTIRDAAGNERGANVNASNQLSVSVDAFTPGTSATSLGKAVDSVAGATDTGVLALRVRDDALAALTPVDGDYTQARTDGFGSTWSRLTESTGAALDLSTGGQIGLKVHVVGDDDKYVRGVVGEDAALVGGPVMCGGRAHSTTPTAVTSGNTVIGLHDTVGRYRMTLDSAAAQPATTEDTASVAGDMLLKVAAIRRDTPVANDNTSTDGDYTQLKLDNTGKLWIAGSHKEDDAHASGDRGVFSLGVANSDTAPTTYAAAQDYTPQAVNTDGSNWVVGNRAHDTVDAGGPVKCGGMASSSRPTAVASGDRVNSYHDTIGIQVVKRDSYNRSDTFTVTGNGTTVDVTTNPMKYFSLQVVQTGTVTAWDVRLEASIDGTNFSQVVAHTNADGTGIVKASVVFPARYFRARCAGLTLGVGTNVIAHILGVQ